MTFRDIIIETRSAITSNLVRSGLTMLGIVIGIASVISMVAIGEGAQASIQSSINSLGSNLVIVAPGASRGAGQVSAGLGSAQTLTEKDVLAIKQDVHSAKAVAPELTRRYQITEKGKNTNTQVIGTEPAYAEVRNVTMDIGTFITAQHLTSAAKVAILGSTTRDNLFGSGVNPVGQKIKINKIEFSVVGLAKTKGGSGFSNPDDAVYVPLTSAQRYLAGQSSISTISLEAVDKDSVAAVQQELTALLLDRHNIPDVQLADFTVINQASIVSAATSVTGIFTILLSSIAGISLLVGGIGIMNMMLTTITERTREIGLRKALGATNGNISLQFLAEAVALTFIGGAIGMLLGWGISLLITQLGIVTTVVTPSSVVLAFGVSTGVGIIFGYYPARRAARLHPIEALRYE